MLTHPVDYSGVLKSHTITFKEKVEEIPGVYSFVFTITEPLTWKAGQHAIFMMPDKKVTGKNWRAFSVASSPNEGVIRIGTNIPPEPSDFKKKLMELTPGETIRMHGPIGEFHASEKEQQIVGIAGGIGITPLRSLAYDVAHGHLPETNLTLIFSAKDKYPYQRELDAWQKQSNQLEIIYTHTPEEVNGALQKQFEIHGNDADYYISGSPGMISALRKSCKKMGIKKIVNDPFKGY